MLIAIAIKKMFLAASLSFICAIDIKANDRCSASIVDQLSYFENLKVKFLERYPLYVRNDSTEPSRQVLKKIVMEYDSIKASISTGEKKHLLDRVYSSYLSGSAAETGITFREVYFIASDLQNIAQSMSQNPEDFNMHVAGSLANNNKGRNLRQKAYAEFSLLRKEHFEIVSKILKKIQSSSDEQALLELAKYRKKYPNLNIYDPKAIEYYQRYPESWEDAFDFFLREPLAQKFNIPWWSIKPTRSEYPSYGHKILSDLDIWLGNTENDLWSAANKQGFLNRLHSLFMLPEKDQIDVYSDLVRGGYPWVEDPDIGTSYRVESQAPLNSLYIDGFGVVRHIE